MATIIRQKKCQYQCPYCGSEDIHCFPINFDWRDTAYSEGKCDECGQEFAKRYDVKIKYKHTRYYWKLSIKKKI